MTTLGDSVDILQETLDSLEEAVTAFEKQTTDVPQLWKAMDSRKLFDVLPERLVLQRPLRIRKVVKPIIGKDDRTLTDLITKYKKKRQILEQQSKILKLKLETIGN